MERLTSYGTFDWVEWQQQVRFDLDCDVPSAIVARLELVVNARVRRNLFWLRAAIFTAIQPFGTKAELKPPG